MLELFCWSWRLLLALSIVADDSSVQWNCCLRFKVVRTTTGFKCFSHCPPLEVVFIWTAQPSVFQLGKKGEAVCPLNGWDSVTSVNLWIYKNTWNSDAMATWLRHCLSKLFFFFIYSTGINWAANVNLVLTIIQVCCLNMQRFKLELILKENICQHF